LPNSTKLNLNSGNKVAYSKTPDVKQPLILLLAIVLVSIAAGWLGFQWYSEEGNKQWFDQNMHSLISHLSDLKHKLATQSTVIASKGALNTGDKPNNNFVSSDPVAPGNIKVWKQTMLSIDELNKKAAIEGGQPSYHNRLGILYAQASDFANATKQFNLAIDLSRGKILRKNDQSKPTNLSSLYVELTCAHSNLAKIYDHLGDHDRAIAELVALNADIAFSNESHLPSVKTQQKTVVLSQVNQLNQAIQNQANQSQPNQNANTNYNYPYNVQLTPEQAALFAKAEALRQVGQIPEAIESYNDLISQVPNFALAHQRLGMAAAAGNNFGLAVNELLTALTLDSRDPDTYNDLGLVYRQLGDFPAAKKAFARGHDIDPKHLALSMNYADSLAKESHFPSALNIMQQAVNYHPDSPAAHNDLGSLYARTGNDRAAAKEFAQTINLNSGLASAHYGLGLAQLNLKSYPQAISELETAQKLNPGILDLQNKLDLANSCNSKEVASASQGTTGVGY